MTLIVDVDVKETPIHVLVVGVGWYGQRSEDGKPEIDTPALPELKGVERSVRRVTEWWKSTGSEMSNGTLASLDVLLSVKNEPSPFNPPVAPATRDKVIEAFTGWRQRCLRAPPGKKSPNATDAIAVLHLIGHGNTDGSAYDNSPKDVVLFCEDPIVEGKDFYLQGLQINNTLDSLRRRKFAELGIVFLDCCRVFQEDREVRQDLKPALEITRGPKRSGQDILLYTATMEGSETYCTLTELKASGFRGGALFTEAAIDALNEYGAELLDDGVTWAACPFTVQKAIKHRLKRWSKHFGIANPSPQLDEQSLERYIVRVREPKSMVDIVPDCSQEFSKAHLELKQNGSVHHPFLNGGEWEADLPVGTWLAEGSVTFGLGRPRPIKSLFDAQPPHLCRKVEVG